MRFGGRPPPQPLDEGLIRRLAALLTETGLQEIEYDDGSRRIRVVRAVAGGASVVAPAVPETTAAPRAPEPVPAAEAGGEVEPDLTRHPGAVKSPMVGTAYLAPQPGAAPFVRIGETVAAGQPLLIIEAMKVMNQIRAPGPGRIARILVEDAEPVEYGAVLMLIE